MNNYETTLFRTWTSAVRLEIECEEGHAVCTYEEKFGEFYIEDIKVENPDHRNKGIGKQLLRAAKQEAESIRARRVTADITSRECLEVMRAVFGDEHVIVESEGTFSGQVSLDDKVDTSAVLNYVLDQA